MSLFLGGEGVGGVEFIYCLALMIRDLTCIFQTGSKVLCAFLQDPAWDRAQWV